MLAAVRRRRAAPVRDVRGAAREGSRVDRRRARRQLPVPGARVAARRSLVPRRFAAIRAAGADAVQLSDAERALRRKTHETIRRVTVDIEERQHLNTAVSALMELVNELYAFSDQTSIGSPARAARRAVGHDRARRDACRRPGGRRGAGADAVAVRAAHGRGALGAPGPRGRAGAARVGRRSTPRRRRPTRSSCRCR